MIWTSILLMTIIDLVVIGVVLSLGILFWVKRGDFQTLGFNFGVALVISGLLVMGLFYFSDLVIMYALPVFLTKEQMTKVMLDLHLNWNWVVSLLGVGSIGGGLWYILVFSLPDVISVLNKQLSRLQITEVIAKAVGSTLEPENIFKIIAEEIRSAVPCDRFSIAVLDSDDELFRTFFERGDFPLGIPSKEVGSGGLFFWEVHRSKRALNIPDLQIDRWKDRRNAKAGYNSLLVIPIMQDGRCISAMLLASRQPAAFTPEHEKLLASVSGHLGSAIHNVQLYKNTKEHASRLEITGKIARAVGSSLDPGEIFKTIATEIRRAVPCEHFVIAKIDVENKIYEFHCEEEVDLLGIYENRALGRISRVVYQTMQPNYIPDLSVDPWKETRPAKAGYRSALAIPIIQENQCIAHMVLSRKEKAAFTDEHENLLIAVAAHLGPAIRNANLYRLSEGRSMRLSVLQELSRKITENLNLDEVLLEIARAVLDLTNGDKSHIFLLDEASGAYGLNASCGDIPDEGSLSIRPGQGVIGKMARTGESVLIRDLHEEEIDWFNPEWLRKFDLHSYIAQPVFREKKVTALINCFSREIGFFGPEELELLGALERITYTACVHEY